MKNEYANAPMGLLDCTTSTPVYPSRPLTLREWITAVSDTIITSVMRRCALRGCWHHGRHDTMLSGRVCSAHYAEYLSE